MRVPKNFCGRGFFWGWGRSSNKSTNQVQIRKLLTHGMPERSLCFLSQKYYSWKGGIKILVSAALKSSQTIRIWLFPCSSEELQGRTKCGKQENPTPTQLTLKSSLKYKGKVGSVTHLTELSAAGQDFSKKR